MGSMKAPIVMVFRTQLSLGRTAGSTVVEKKGRRYRGKERMTKGNLGMKSYAFHLSTVITYRNL